MTSEQILKFQCTPISPKQLLFITSQTNSTAKKPYGHYFALSFRMVSTDWREKKCRIFLSIESGKLYNTTTVQFITSGYSINTSGQTSSFDTNKLYRGNFTPTRDPLDTGGKTTLCEIVSGLNTLSTGTEVRRATGGWGEGENRSSLSQPTSGDCLPATTSLQPSWHKMSRTGPPARHQPHPQAATRLTPTGSN